MEGLLGVCLDDATFFEDGAFGGAFDECIAGATEPRVDAEVSILWLVGEVFGFDERRHVGRGGVGVRFRAAAELCVCVLSVKRWVVGRGARQHQRRWIRRVRRGQLFRRIWL